MSKLKIRNWNNQTENNNNKKKTIPYLIRELRFIVVQTSVGNHRFAEFLLDVFQLVLEKQMMLLRLWGSNLRGWISTASAE